MDKLTKKDYSFMRVVRKLILIISESQLIPGEEVEITSSDRHAYPS
jgi:hypothetical protein